MFIVTTHWYVRKGQRKNTHNQDFYKPDEFMFDCNLAVITILYFWS